MTFNISAHVNRESARWIALAAVMLLTLTATVGIAAADLDGTETEFYNNTTEVDNATTEIKVTVNGTNDSNVYVNYYRIANDSNATETLESEDLILSSATGNTTNATYAVETNNTAAYRVVVHDNGDGLNASEVGDINVAALSGGGTGFFTGTDGKANWTNIVGLVVVVLAGAAILGDD